MAKRPRAPTGLEEGDEDDKKDVAGKKLSPLERAEIEQQEKVLALLEKHRDTGAYLEVSVKEPGKMEWEFLDTVPIDTYNVKSFSERFGGGSYRLIAKTDRNQFISTWYLSVSKSIVPVRANSAIPAAAGAKSEVAEAMREFKETMKPLIERALAPVAPTTSTLAEIMPLMVASVSRPEPKQDNELFRMMMEFQTKSEERVTRMIDKMSEKMQAPKEDTFALIGKVLELREQFGGDAPEEKKNNLLEFAKAFGPAAVDLVRHYLSQNRSGPQPAQRIAQPAAGARSDNAANGAAAATPAAESQPIEVQSNEEDMNLKLQFMLSQFKSSALAAARKGKDAAEFASNTLDLVPEEFWPKIFAAANSEDWFTQLFKNDAEAMKQLPWITEMRNAMLARMVVWIAKAQFIAQTSPEESAAAIVKAMAKNFHDYLLNETEETNWAMLFQDVQSSAQPFDLAWLESLRIAIDNLTGGDEQAKAAAPNKATDKSAKAK